MASNPPGKCCTVGKLHEGTPTGESITIGSSLKAYLARASEKSNAALIIFPDVFGIWQNTKLMADEFAARGYTTLVPDMFNGDQLDISTDLSKFDIMGWFQKGSDGNNPHGQEQIDAIGDESVKYLKEQGFEKIAGAGYCIGAKYVVRQLKSSLSAGFIAHPSFVSPEELTAITGPLSIAAAEFDHIFPAAKRHESEELLPKTKQPWQINLFADVYHGFGIRGDMSEKKVKFAKEQAFLQAVTWFDEHLAGRATRL